MKSRIVEQLGEGEIILPNLVAEGLRANDRAKVRLSALQAALQHAHDPQSVPADLSAECRNAGIDAAGIRSVIGGAGQYANGVVTAPNLAQLGTALMGDVAIMIDAVRAADHGAGEAAEVRLAGIRSSLNIGTDTMLEADIATLTAVADEGRDSLHRLIMDLHRALNRLAAEYASEVVDGARTYGLTADDKPIIAAFMRGLARTRGLKFNHPGLDTTAIRTGPKLIIQNDIGTTDAHVLLVSVEDLTVTITHTDVHRTRAEFFVGLFRAFPVEWSGLHAEKAEGLAEGEPFYLVTGRYRAETSEQRNALLDAVGAALVFLIDWNKARKALRKLISNEEAIRVLAWAARHEYGHRAWLEFGGTELLASAVRHAIPARIGFGEELGIVLGRDGPQEFMRAALRLCTDARRNGRSSRSVHEALEADLIRRVERNESTLLATVVRQLGLARDLAVGIAATTGGGQSDQAANTASAAKAKHIEEKADAIALEARNSIARTQASPLIAQLVNAAEDSIDELEQAAFMASLVPQPLNPLAVEPLNQLCTAAISATEAAARGVEAAAGLSEGESADSEDALEAAERLVDIEHAADVAERAITRAVFGGDAAVKPALSVLELARALERASDRLAAMGHVLHNHVMAGLSR